MARRIDEEGAQVMETNAASSPILTVDEMRCRVSSQGSSPQAFRQQPQD